MNRNVLALGNAKASEVTEGDKQYSHKYAVYAAKELTSSIGGLLGNGRDGTTIETGNNRGALETAGGAVSGLFGTNEETKKQIDKQISDSSRTAEDITKLSKEIATAAGEKETYASTIEAITNLPNAAKGIFDATQTLSNPNVLGTLGANEYEYITNNPAGAIYNAANMIVSLDMYEAGIRNDNQIYSLGLIAGGIILDTGGKIFKGIDKAADAAKATANAAEGLKAGSKIDNVVNTVLQSNVSYYKNGYTFTTDYLGRVIIAQVGLVEGKGIRDPIVKLMAGGVYRLPTDHGSHLIATRFLGPEDAFNIVAGNANLNLSAYKKLENTWARALKEGKNVNVKITPVYESNSLRPSKLDIRYSINGERFFDSLQNTVGGIK